MPNPIVRRRIIQPHAASAPAAPSSLTAVNAPTGVALTWADNSNNETGFKIYRDGVLIHTTAANATSYTDTGATNGTTHTYSVKATNGATDSAAATTTGKYVYLSETFAAASGDIGGTALDTASAGGKTWSAFFTQITGNEKGLRRASGKSQNTLSGTDDGGSHYVDFESANQHVIMTVKCRDVLGGGTQLAFGYFRLKDTDEYWTLWWDTSAGDQYMRMYTREPAYTARGSDYDWTVYSGAESTWHIKFIGNDFAVYHSSDLVTPKISGTGITVHNTQTKVGVGVYDGNSATLTYIADFICQATT